MTRKNRKDDERFYQREFITALESFAESKKIKVFIDIDEDTQMRVIKSGYDFSLMRNGKVIYIETKVSDAKTDNYDIFNKLEDYQKITMTNILLAGGVYAVLEWNYTKKTFLLYLLVTRSNGKLLRVEREGIVEIMKTLLDWLEG